jgi:hypothetical protein
LDLPKDLLPTIESVLLRGERVMLIGRKEFRPSLKLFALPCWLLVLTVAWFLSVLLFNSVIPPLLVTIGSLLVFLFPGLAVIISVGIFGYIAASRLKSQSTYFVLTDDRLLKVVDSEVKEIGKKAEIVRYEVGKGYVTMQLANGECMQIAIISKP